MALDIKALSELSGVEKPLIRYFVRNKIIEKPKGRGPSSRYDYDEDEDSLEKLRLAKRLRDERRTARSVLKERLMCHSRGPWHRYVITEGLEVFVESSLEKAQKANVDGARNGLLELYREEKGTAVRSEDVQSWHRYVITPGFEVFAECNTEKSLRMKLSLICRLLESWFPLDEAEKKKQRRKEDGRKKK